MKHILQMKEVDKCHQGHFLQKYFLSYSLNNLAKTKYPQWLFLTGSPKSLSKLPFFYKDVVERIKNDIEIFNITQKTAKNIYSHISHQKENLNLKLIQLRWEAKFQKNLPWNKIWEINFDSHAQGTSKNTHWRILTNSLPTIEKINSWKVKRGQFHGNSKCKNCNREEDTLHPFIFCSKARAVWKKMRTIYEKLLPLKPFNSVQALFLINIEDLPRRDSTAKIINSITHITTNELWRCRNTKLKENHDVPAARIAENILKEIKYIWKIQYNKYSRENNIEKFHKIF